jgi:Spy/CpxP family protein refolding chaperone
MRSNASILSGTSGWLLSISLLVILRCFDLPALCQDEHVAVGWSKLNLNSQQSKRIQELEEQWRRDYGELKPAIAEDQRRIGKLLGDHNLDPVEIMALQSSLSRKKEQLSALALSNYLKKREVLTDNQRRTLEIMMRQAIAEREQNTNGSALTQTAPDRIQGLMQRARNAWTTQGER